MRSMADVTSISFAAGVDTKAAGHVCLPYSRSSLVSAALSPAFRPPVGRGFFIPR